MLSGCSSDDSQVSTGSGGSSGGGSGGATTSGSGGTAGTTTASTSASGGGGSTGDPCAGEITGFVPEWKPSTGLHQGLCDESQIDEFFAACIVTGATEEDCTAVTMASPNCAQCLLSAPDAPAFGPMTLYEDQNLIYENPGQCISEIEMDPSDASCGAKVYAAIACTIAACSTCTDMDFNVVLDCLAAAEQGDCKDLFAARDTCVTALEGEGLAIEPCIYDPSTDFDAYLLNLAKLNCGP